MNRFEIRDILSQHKEHFRVLPTNAMNAVLGIIQSIDSEERLNHQDTVIALQAAHDVAELNQEKASVVGKRTRKDKKKSARSKR